jgi:hypothetical protein
MALAEADMGLTELAFQEVGRADPGDEQLLVKFFVHPRKMARESAKEGRPIFEDCEYISIKVPGNRGSAVERPATSKDKARFPRHYAAFKAKDREVLVGTPLEEWPGIARSQVEELRFFNIQTVEQLVDLTDTNAQNFRGIEALKTRARDFLEAAKGSAATVELRAELESRDQQIAALQQAVADQAARIEELITSRDVPDSERSTKPSGGRSRAKSGK